MIRPFIHILFILLSALPAAAALDLNFPGPAIKTLSETQDFGSYSLPVGPSAGAPIPTIVAEGLIEQSAWRVETALISTVTLMDDLRQQIERKGFELLYECSTRDCGGFDFRFDTLVLPEPAMHVDLGDFRFLSAQRLGQASPEYVSVLVSRSAEFSFVQLIHVGSLKTDPSEPSEPNTTNSPEPRPVIATEPAITTVEPTALGDALKLQGRAVLDDLVFETGSSSLGPGPFPSLVDLAAILTASPSLRIALVGHTDNKGSLQGNLNLSRRRADSVASRLIEEYSIPTSRIAADGVGFLAPRASNQTEEGRSSNRRVEVVITSSE